MDNEIITMGTNPLAPNPALAQDPGMLQLRGVFPIALVCLIFGALVVPAQAAGKPDLVVSSLSNPPAQKARGSAFTVNETTKNIGGARAGRTTTRYFLSKDRTKSKSDRVVSSRSVPRLRPNRKSSVAKSLTISATLPLGNYFVIACADAKKAVRESREGNNCRASTTSMTVVAPAPACEPLFSEDFSDNAASWVLGTEWQVGQATAGTTTFGNPDPASDHTATTDDGVAGVILGGNYTTEVHAGYWLESPAIDVTALDTVTFKFWRWLNTDYPPFVSSMVHVWDGDSWELLWSGPSPNPGDPPPILDSAWTLQTFDLTPFKNAALRVRFGHSVDGGGANAYSGWNVDDISIGDC